MVINCNKKWRQIGLDSDKFHETINIVPKGSDVLKNGDIVALTGADKDIAQFLEETGVK